MQRPLSFSSQISKRSAVFGSILFEPRGVARVCLVPFMVITTGDPPASYTVRDAHA